MGEADRTAVGPERKVEAREVLHLPTGTGRTVDARRFVCDTVVGWGASAASVDDVALLTSEVVGNALVHAGGPVTVGVGQRGAELVIEVRDDSPELPMVQPADPARPGGLGLRIVEAIAMRWGVETDTDRGKTVWFELPMALPARRDGAEGGLSSRGAPRDR